MALLAIDPGLNSMGWAYWRYPEKGFVPASVGLIKAPRKMELTVRAHWIAEEVFKTIPQIGGPNAPPLFKTDIVSEFPAWHGTSMAWSTGDLQRLVFLVGVLCGRFSLSKFTLVTPAEWKGQLPKDVVIRRLQKKLGRRVTQDYDKDMWDAVGIGLWKLGEF
jgi:hypothetical protein